MTEPRIAELVDRAFDYRGYVTLRRSDGSAVVGFVYDRGASHVDVFDETATQRTRIPLNQIAGIDFTGDDAARRSQEIWERRKGRLEPRDTPAHGEWADPAKVLLIVALDRELKTVSRGLGLAPRGSFARGTLSGHAVAAAAIGIGGGAGATIARERPSLVLSCGFCGSLDPGLAPGDLVLATSVRGSSGGALAASGPARQAVVRRLHGLRFVEGELIHATSVAATPHEKRALARPGAVAVDMETFPVARAAAEAGLPWLALRAVVDGIDASLPPFAREARRSYLWPALRHALSGPRAAVGLVRLARDATRAAAALEAGLRRIGPSLGLAEERQ